MVEVKEVRWAQLLDRVKFSANCDGYLYPYWTIIEFIYFVLAVVDIRLISESGGGFPLNE